MNKLATVSTTALIVALLTPALGCQEALQEALSPTPDPVATAPSAPVSQPEKAPEAKVETAAPTPTPAEESNAKAETKPEPESKIVIDEKKLAVFGERAVRMLERIGQDAKASKGDCAKLGKTLAVHQSEDAKNAKALKAFDAGKSSEQKRAERKFLDKKFEKRMNAALESMKSMQSCKDDPSVKKYATEVFTE
jgi:hypothetical protein